MKKLLERKMRNLATKDDINLIKKHIEAQKQQIDLLQQQLAQTQAQLQQTQSALLQTQFRCSDWENDMHFLSKENLRKQHHSSYSIK